MKTQIRQFIVVFAVFLSFIVPSSNPLFAATYYYLSYTGAFNSATCSNTSFSVNVNYAWNLPPTGTKPSGFDFYPGGSHGGSYLYHAGISTGTVPIGLYTFANTAYPYTVSEAISTVAGGTTYSASITLMCSGSNQVSLVSTTSFPPPTPPTVVSNGGYMPPPPVFSDDRLNNNDAGETVAIYCEADGSVKVMAIYASKGYLAFLASPDEIAKVPQNPTVNTAIKSGNGATLYRLMSGELQVNRAENDTGKMYHFTFSDCPKPQK